MPAIKVKAGQGDRFTHDNSISASLCHWCGIESYNLPPYKQGIYITGVTIWICPYSECCDKAICFIVHLVWESCTWGCALACSKLICLMITSNREYWIRTLPYQKEHKSYYTILYVTRHAKVAWTGENINTWKTMVKRHTSCRYFSNKKLNFENLALPSHICLPNHVYLLYNIITVIFEELMEIYSENQWKCLGVEVPSGAVPSLSVFLAERPTNMSKMSYDVTSWCPESSPHKYSWGWGLQLIHIVITYDTMRHHTGVVHSQKSWIIWLTEVNFSEY